MHPDKREVFALAPGPIVKGDGAKKNDGERNAAKRLLSDVRCEPPHLKRRRAGVERTAHQAPEGAGPALRNDGPR